MLLFDYGESKKSSSITISIKRLIEFGLFVFCRYKKAIESMPQKSDEVEEMAFSDSDEE